MPEGKVWRPGDACANCGGPVGLVPLPSDEERKAAADMTNYVQIPTTKDTAPAKFIEENGRLYRCPVDGFSIRTKEPPPVDPGVASLGALASADASLKAAHDTLTARVDALRSDVDGVKSVLELHASRDAALRADVDALKAAVFPPPAAAPAAPAGTSHE